jgi:DNA-binding CsgD family transcriptional regulator
MHRIFQNFIDRLSTSGDAEDLREAMAEAISAFDLRCFAYLSLPHGPQEQPQLISTYPLAWTTHYMRNHYERFDPVVVRLLANPEPFSWDLEMESHDLTSPQKEALSEAAQFGISYGFTVPIHDGRGSIAAVTFATDRRWAHFQRKFEENARVLQLMAMYFHAQVRRKLVSTRTFDGVTLSPREFECLEWAAQGKSAWEIGQILSISRHTVTTYLENAKLKLGVRTVIQAVARLAASKSIGK